MFSVSVSIREPRPGISSITPSILLQICARAQAISHTVHVSTTAVGSDQPQENKEPTSSLNLRIFHMVACNS